VVGWGGGGRLGVLLGGVGGLGVFFVDFDDGISYTLRSAAAFRSMRNVRPFGHTNALFPCQFFSCSPYSSILKGT